MASQVANWLEERFGLADVIRYVLFRQIPEGVNWWYTFGSISMFLFTLQLATGIMLTMSYAPSPDNAYDSVRYINDVAVFGAFIRGIHKWAASGMVLAVFVHMLRVYYFGSYKYPREMTWVVGVVLLLLVLGFGFTGYLLPWDQKAYWATEVGTNIAGLAPFLGTYVLQIMRGGGELGAVTLTRFYSIHVMILPLLTLLFITVHLYLVVKLGISAPPKE